MQIAKARKISLINQKVIKLTHITIPRSTIKLITHKAFAHLNMIRTDNSSK